MINNIKPTLLIIAALLIGLAANKSFATDYNAQARSIADGIDLNGAFTQENVDEVPGYEGPNTSQSSYYNNPNSMESDSNSQSQNSESGNLANDVFYKSGKIDVNENEEWLENSNNVQDNPTDFISIISSTDNNCSDANTSLENQNCKVYYKSTPQKCTNTRSIDVESYHQYQCFKDKYSYERQCEQDLNLACAQSYYTLPPITYNDFEAFSFNYPYINIGSGRRRGQNCSGYIYQFKFYLEDVNAIESFRLNMVSVDDRTVFYLNNLELYKFPNSNRCELWATRTSYPNFDFKPYLKKGENIFKVRFVVGGLGNFTSRLELKYKACQTYSSNQWVESCTTDLGEEDDSCSEKQKICNIGKESRDIGQGVKEARDCWSYDVTKECQPNSLINYCKDLHDDTSCTQLSSQCNDENDKECINFANNYKCSSQSIATNNKVIYHGTNKEIESEYVNTAKCDDFSNSSYCSFESEKCLDNSNSLTKNIDGLEIFRNCWNYEQSYNCLSEDEANSDCKILSDNNQCSLSSSSCLVYDGNFCTINQKSYSCQTSDSDIAICSAPVNCEDEECDEIDYTKDQNFGRASASLAILEDTASELDFDNLSTFTGYGAKCSKDVAGLKNCCDMTGWEDSFTEEGLTNSLGYPDAKDLAIDASEIILGQCSRNEKGLAFDRANKKCVYIGTYCSKEIELGLDEICIEKKQTHCCFKSRLSRVIHEQGRGQVGKSWGSPEAPNCSGFSIEQLQTIDFEKIDFSEIANEFKEKASSNAPSSSQIASEVQEAVNRHYEEVQE